MNVISKISHHPWSDFEDIRLRILPQIEINNYYWVERSHEQKCIFFGTVKYCPIERAQTHYYQTFGTRFNEVKVIIIKSSNIIVHRTQYLANI